MVSNNTLVGKLKFKQGNLSDYKFTNILGIERTLWTNVRNGKRPITLTILKSIVRTYPELIPDVLTFLRDNNHEQT